MDTHLSRLCSALEDELERQETILSLCRSQEKGLRGGDASYLEARTNGLNVLLREAAEAEPARNALVRACAVELGLPAGDATLSALALAAGPPWADRLADLQRRLRRTLLEAREAVRLNAQLARRSLRRVNACMDLITRGDEPPQAGYSPAGMEASNRAEGARMIDHRG